MGIDDRDDYRSRGQAARRRGSYESNEPPAGRSQYRGGRDDAPRGRPRGPEDAYSSRSGGRRDYGYEDDPRSSSGSRYQRGYDGSSGHERRPGAGQSGGARRPRPDWDDGSSARRDRRGPEDYARGDRSGRGQRPPMREYTDASMRARGAPRGMADSGGRGRAGAALAPQRGGVWGDEPTRATGLRSGVAGARDPRALRRGAAADEEEEATSAGAAFGKALLAIILALVLGAGAAYGYYMVSAPKLPASVTQPSTTPGAGSSGSSGARWGATAQSASAGDSRGSSHASVIQVAGAANWRA